MTFVLFPAVFWQWHTAHGHCKMPTYEWSHQDSRDKVCACCGIRTPKKKRMNESEAKLVEKYCKPNFDTTFTLREQPAGLCSTCRWYLYACKRGENWEEIQKPDPRLRWDAYEMEHGRFREKEHDPAECQVCLLAKWNPVGERETSADKRYIMKSIREPVPPERTYKFCNNCYQHIGRGIPHPPCTPATAKKNLANLVSQLSTNDQGQVVAEVLKGLQASSSSSSSDQDGSSAQLKLNRLRGGNKLTVTLGKIKTKPIPISTDFMVSLMKKLNCSERKLLMLYRQFKSEGVNFDPNLREDMQALSHSLDSFYKVEKLDFMGKDENKEDIPVQLDLVYLEDTEAFITYVIGERDLDEDKVIVRVGLDGGQGSFKVVGSIFETTSHLVDTPGEKLAGANKLLVFALAEDLSENYHNVRLVVEKLGLAELDCVFASDLKLINVLLGISSHSGKHGCAYCEGEMTLELGELRTFGNLAEWHRKLIEDAGRSRNRESFIRRNQKNYKNVVNPCLLKGEPDTTILSSIPLPELHLLMGCVNWALEVLYKVVPKDDLQRRMRTKSISVHGYHGGGLDGNNSSNFLKNLDFIFEPLPDTLQPVYTMLTTFKKVVDSCFSMDLALTYEEDIDTFNQSVYNMIDHCQGILNINLKPTWKMHILVCHLKPFLDEKQTGLGINCEQTSEAAHVMMQPTTKRFKRRSDHQLHGAKLFRSACDYSAKNM